MREREREREREKERERRGREGRGPIVSVIHSMHFIVSD